MRTNTIYYLNTLYYNKEYLGEGERKQTSKNWSIIKSFFAWSIVRTTQKDATRFNSILWSHIGTKSISVALYTSRPIIDDAVFRNQRQFVIVIMRTILLPRVNYRTKMWRRPTTINTAAFARRGVIAGCHVSSIVAYIEYPCIQSLVKQLDLLVPQYFTIFEITTVIPRQLNRDRRDWSVRKSYLSWVVFWETRGTVSIQAFFERSARVLVDFWYRFINILYYITVLAKLFIRRNICQENYILH